MVTKRDGGTDDEYPCRLAFVKQQLSHHRTDTSSDIDDIIQFVTKRSCHHMVMNQVSPQRESSVILAQLKDPDKQMMIHISRDGGFPPNYVNFESRFFPKLFRNRSRLEVNHDVLYQKYFHHTVKITSS